MSKRTETVEHRLRMKLLDGVGVAGDLTTIAEGMPDADRRYMLREIERMQTAAHRMLAFLDDCGDGSVQ